MPKFVRGRVKYKEIERLTPSEARERRLTALLERERRFSDVPGFVAGLERSRSQSHLEKSFSLAQSIVNEPQAKVHKAASIAAALKQFKEKDFANPQARAAYRSLRQAQLAIESGRSLQKVSRVRVNRSYYNPTGKDFAGTTGGGIARLSNWTGLGSSWTRVFANPGSVLPCIDRLVRREVMFGLGKAGKGYRVKHRRTWASGVPC